MSPPAAATRSAGCPTRLPPTGNLRWRPPQPPASVEGRPRRDPVRAELPAEAEPVRAAGPAVRGLPVPERLHADVAPRREAAGARVDPRRRLHPGRRAQLRRHQARGGRHRRRHDQLPARRARLPRASGARVAARRVGRQLRLDGSAGGAALGQSTTSRQFGGDPHNVTIAGQSAGGVSVLAHLVSPAIARALPAGDRARAARSR